MILIAGRAQLTMCFSLTTLSLYMSIAVWRLSSSDMMLASGSMQYSAVTLLINGFTLIFSKQYTTFLDKIVLMNTLAINSCECAPVTLES